MSYASNHLSQYDGFIRQGIVNWLGERLGDAGFQVAGEWFQGYEALVEVMQIDPEMRGVYDELVSRAYKQIAQAEAEYFSGLTDIE
jgi:hypothetical protein